MPGYRRLAGTEEVVWNGRRYRRVPNHPVWHRRAYFMATTAPRSYLHRDVFVANNGPIPDGYQVHHRDHNPLNNKAENLVTLSPQEHAAHHRDSREPLVYECHHCGNSFASYKRAKNVRWCSARCKEAARRAAGLVKPRARVEVQTLHRICNECGLPYSTTKPWARFCGPVCRGRYGRRRRSQEAQVANSIIGK